ncbi:MAG: RNA polymerase sigma factor [Eubacteriales bacterium]|nr:RNA polymerase sigma factor [Eubacteriales bacterium]
MDDNGIIDLFWKRSEQAIAETAGKYGGYCYRIAYQVLSNREDAEESVNDTYLAAWNSLPPHRPSVLTAFLGKLARRISIDRWRGREACKRGGGEIVVALEELGECVAGGRDVEGEFLRKETVRAFNAFLDTLPDTERDVFLLRYFSLDSVRDIAGRFGFTESKVTSMLHRTRSKLRSHLKKEELL